MYRLNRIIFYILLDFVIWFWEFLPGRAPAGRAIRSNLFCEKQKRISAAIPHAAWSINPELLMKKTMTPAGSNVYSHNIITFFTHSIEDAFFTPHSLAPVLA